MIIIIIYCHHLHHHLHLHQILDQINCINLHHHQQIFWTKTTTSSNRVFPPKPPPTINTQIDFLTNTPAISESSQINDFLTLLPEIPKFELYKISKPKRTKQHKHWKENLKEWLKRKHKRKKLYLTKTFLSLYQKYQQFQMIDIWKRTREKERGRRANKIWNRPIKVKRWTWRGWSSEKTWILFWRFKQKNFPRMSKVRCEWRKYIFHWFWKFRNLEILLSSNFGISGNNVKKSLIWDDSGMAGVFVKKSICVFWKQFPPKLVQKSLEKILCWYT